MSEAAVYRCPACGAPAEPKAAACAYCRAQLEPARCPWCFAWTDVKVRDCPRCGASAEAPAAEGRSISCPSCRQALAARSLGGARLSGCADCGGVWADAASFKRICDDRSAQAAYLGEGSALARPAANDPSAAPVRYRPCPVCGEMMNRFNFAGCSGVILDACKPHGVWFDADELRRIVEFIRGGGLDVARAKEREAIEFERRRLERAAQPPSGPPASSFSGPDSLAAARGLLEFLAGFGD